MDLEVFIQTYKHLIPEDFDWKFYVNYYADLKQAGINSENLAKYHYINYGRKENREYARQIKKINKIFQIGFNKTGTFSIHSLFNNYAKLSSIHWDNGNLAKTIHNNIQTGKKLPLDDYNNYTVYTDMECFIEENNKLFHIMVAKEYFDILDVNYPNSLFIFNTRPIDKWIKSRLNHKFFYNNKETKYVDTMKKVTGLSSLQKIKNFWIEEYNNHLFSVTEYFSREPQKLLIYDIENDKLDKLSSFLQPRNIYLKTDTFPHENKS